MWKKQQQLSLPSLIDKRVNKNSVIPHLYIYIHIYIYIYRYIHIYIYIYIYIYIHTITNMPGKLHLALDALPLPCFPLTIQGTSLRWCQALRWGISPSSSHLRKLTLTDRMIPQTGARIPTSWKIISIPWWPMIVGEWVSLLWVVATFNESLGISSWKLLHQVPSSRWGRCF